MLHFKSLKLSGFKSFIEKTDLEISSGLTGIVGPNGCGKSNLVEALRWTMGESSAKRMRGDGMEDVIFAGTEKRPARNFAEVSLTLDNRSRSAPAAYNNLEEIEITRKIVRDQGSAYRINGRPARARDVQLLFADTLSGASSPALVSQGKIATIINAKPLQRRMILEESAGITGLFARRHEAELRLKQAEKNLTRIEDTTGGMESRLSTLKRQARQAARYKDLSQEIRTLDQLIAYLEWKAGEEQLLAYKKEFETYEARVAEQMATVTQLNKTYLTQTQDVPKLREEEAKTAARLQKYKLDLQRIEDREDVRARALEENKQQQQLITSDIEHSKNELAEYKSTLERTDSEQKKIQSEESNTLNLIKTRTQTLEASEKRVQELEERHNTATAGEAARQEQEKSLTRLVEQDQSRLERLTDKITQANDQKTRFVEEQKEFHELSVKEKDLSALLEKVEKLSKEKEKFAANIETHAETLKALQDKRQDTSIDKSKLDSEISTLTDFINSFSEESDAQIINDVNADSGFEAALSRALGDNLQASLDKDALSYWIEIEREALPLPTGTKCLKDVVTAPKALWQALSQIGIVDTTTQGETLMLQLQQGQSLVSADGHYWRWDGFCMKAEAPDKQSVFLKQKNKLSELEKKSPALEKSLSEADENIQALEQTIDATKAEKETAETQHRDLSRQAQSLENDIAADKIRQESRQREMDTLERTLSELTEEKALLSAQLSDNTEKLKGLRDSQTDERANHLQSLKSGLNDARIEHQNNISALERIEQQQNSRKARLRALADERVTMQNRIIRGEEHLGKQQKRLEDIAAKLAELTKEPQESDDNKETYLSKIEELDQQRGAFADELSVKESEAGETSKALKQAESDLYKAREDRARVQALFGAAQDTQNNVIRAIEEKFETTPQNLLQNVAKVEDYTPQSLEEKRERRQQILRQREAIGPVNLQAETEADELDKELGTLLHEKNDLLDAINELRGGIKELNVEARHRLNLTFERVNAHFQNLFKRLFVGGQAHLALIESDDPLEAGLEIFAQPPGKSLQALSLMSGGEQTMTSIALIFAMFLTNPAPICVLDEIDAPLDDANVDKVCDLLEEISETTKTRFLIVTHHRLTMARMDRIYGVTMSEKGVSQLVSLDMQQSFGFLEDAA